jgi:hypothetical protein
MKRKQAAVSASNAGASKQTTNRTLKAIEEGRYAPTAREQRSIDAYFKRHETLRPMPKQVIEFNGKVPDLKDDHADPAVGATLTMMAMGMSRVGELTGFLQDAINLTQQDGKPDAHRMNEMLAQIASIEPRDSIEAMLATQMVAVHRATIIAARQLRGSQTIPQQDSNSNMLNKLTRTFASQVEALKRYRSKGEQKVIVEHVTVNEGGQAIVGNVATGGRGSK